MNYVLEDTVFAEQQNLTMQAGGTPAPFILRLALFISVVLLGTVSANNVYPSQIGSFLSQVNIVILGMAALLFGFIGKGWKIQIPVETSLSLFFVLWAATGFAVAKYMSYFVTSYVTLVKTVGMYLIIVNIVRSRKDLLWMAVAYVATVTFLFTMGSEIMVEAAAVGARAAGTVGDANGLATWATIGLISSVMCFNCFRNVLFKIVVLLPIPIFILMINRSGSRSGMLGIILVAFLIYWWYIRGQVQERPGLVKLASFAVGCILTASAVYVAITSEFWFRMEYVLGIGQYSSHEFGEGDPRIGIWREVPKIILGHPFIGIGYLQMRVVTGLQAHNTWVEATASAGIPGLLMWFSSFIILTRKIWKIRKSPLLSPVDRGVVSMCLIFIAFWWFRSMLFNHLGEKEVLPVVAGMTGYICHLRRFYGLRSDFSSKDSYDYRD